MKFIIRIHFGFLTKEQEHVKKNKKIYSKIKQTNRQKSGLRTPKEGKIKNQNYLVAENPQANEIEQSPINSGVRDSASLTTKFHRRPIN